jgi:DNA-binding NtrC family response regulator
MVEAGCRSHWPPNRAARLPPERGKGGRMQALIVHESCNMRRFLHAILASAGFSVIESDNAEAAEQMLRWDPAEVGLFQCPRLRAGQAELLGRLRDNPECRHMKILMVAEDCNCGATDEARCERTGERIVKPFNGDRIFDKLKAMGMIQ